MILSPREDIRPEEGCFYALTEDGMRIGYIKVFKDGSAGYWTELCEQAKVGATPELAYAILRRRWDVVLESAHVTK